MLHRHTSRFLDTPRMALNVHAVDHWAQAMEALGNAKTGQEKE
jgi:hypothetical protein